MVSPHLSLLADDGDSILKLHIMEKALEKNVGHSDQVVVLVRLIERIRLFTISFVMLEKKIGNFYLVFLYFLSKVFSV